MTTSEQLEVTSHVGRDILASARLFKEDKDVVWEYVVNSLQYVARGVAPRVQVRVMPRKRIIEIRDNGRGMDAAGLKHFFEMHAENLDRKQGRAGRGKFGTGKSAAFGIARELTVDTRRGGLRNVVRLTRDDIDESTGENIPVKWLVRNDESDFPDGTVVTIEDIFLKRINTQRIVEYVERHLQAFRASEPEVAINDHVCRYWEPEIDGEPRIFEPSPSQRAALGDARLEIKVSRAPLSEPEIGVVVTAGEGNTVAIETGGVDRKELGNYLFGAINVPELDKEVEGLEAYDSTRSLRLNINHPIAAQLIAFISSRLEQVRKELVARAREASKSEQAQRLAREADQIAEVLNKDFEEVRRRLQEIRSAATAAGSASAVFGGGAEGSESDDEWVEGEQTPGVLEDAGGSRSPGEPKGRSAPVIPRAGTPDPEGLDSVDPAGGNTGNRRKPRGGFTVEYQNLGKESTRSTFDSNKLAILINLDHAVVSAALGDGAVEDPAFRRLSYEIAFAEYSMGLGYRMVADDPDMPADDLLFEVRDTLNRVSKAAAQLYR